MSESIEQQFTTHPLGSGRDAVTEQDNAWPYVEKNAEWWAKMFHFEWIKDRASGPHRPPSEEVIKMWFEAAMDRGRDNLLIELEARDGNVFNKGGEDMECEGRSSDTQYFIAVPDREKERKAFDWAVTNFGCYFIHENNAVVKNPRWDYAQKHFGFRDENDAALFRIFWG